MRNLSSLGLNNKLQALSSLAVKQENFVNSMSFDSNYEIQGKNIKVSRPNFGTIVLLSGTASAQGTVNNGTHVVITSTLSPAAGFSNNMIAGWTSQEVFEGTTNDTNFLIFPAPGGSIAADRYRCFSGYRQLGGAEINHRHQTTIYNNSGATGTVFAIARWKYIMNGGGIVG
ncbi:MAG: hypothetical protein AABY15_09790 [Nanoarchaeota archaeon]